MDPEIIEAINDYTHSLKSPLAKIKALSLIIRSYFKTSQSFGFESRSAGHFSTGQDQKGGFETSCNNSKNREVINQKISALEDCVDILNERIGLLFEFINMNKGNQPLELSFFKLKKMLDQLSKKYYIQTKGEVEHEILGDFRQIKKAIILVLDERANIDVKSIRISISKKNKGVSLLISSKSTPETKDHLNPLSIPLVIAGNIIKMHGGTIKKRAGKGHFESEIYLPDKPTLNQRQTSPTP